MCCLLHLQDSTYKYYEIIMVDIAHKVVRQVCTLFTRLCLHAPTAATSSLIMPLCIKTRAVQARGCEPRAQGLSGFSGMALSAARMAVLRNGRSRPV